MFPLADEAGGGLKLADAEVSGVDLLFPSPMRRGWIETGMRSHG